MFEGRGFSFGLQKRRRAGLLRGETKKREREIEMASWDECHSPNAPSEKEKMKRGGFFVYVLSGKLKVGSRSLPYGEAASCEAKKKKRERGGLRPEWQSTDTDRGERVPRIGKERGRQMPASGGRELKKRRSGKRKGIRLGGNARPDSYLSV